MSLIEGVGDEVTVGCGILLLLCLVLLAWFSTHTREIPFVSIIVVELTQRRRLINRNRTEASQERSTTGEAAPSESSAAGSQTTQDAAASEGESERTDTDVSSEEVSDHSPNRKNNQLGITSDLPSASDDGAAKNSDSAVGESSDNPDQSVIKNKPKTGITAAAEAVPNDTTHSQDSVENVAATLAQSRGLNSDCLPFADCQNLKADSGSPDEVRKRRVAYFEASRKKEYTESNDDSRTESTGKGATAATAETVGRLCESQAGVHIPETIRSQSQESDAPVITDSSSPAANVHSLENIPGPEAAGSVQSDEDNGNSATTSEQIRVRLKYLNDTQRLVYTSPEETIGNFRRTHFSTELGENKIVRFIFNGQDLRNDLRTLSAYNIADNSVIHCLITQSRQVLEQESPNAAHHMGEDELEIGVFIYPIFGLILGVLWYFRFSYKQYFNAVSTVSLAGVSFIYCLALVSSLRGRQQPHQHLD